MPRYLNFLVVILIIIFLSTICNAYNVIDFISNEKHLLKEDESLESATTKIKEKNVSYYVVPVISGDSLITFIPAKTSTKELSTNRTINRKLFEMQYVVRSYLLNKKQASQNPSAQWFFTATNAAKIRTLSQLLSDESYELTTIESEANNFQISEQLTKMKSMLSALSQQARLVSTTIEEVLRIEGLFSVEVETSTKDEFKITADKAFTEMSAFEEKALLYNAEVSKLKSYISTAPSLSADQKTFLLNLAAPPADFTNIGNWASQARNLKQIIDGIYNYSGTTIDSYLDEFEKRVQMDHAYTILYGQNDKLLELNSEFTSVSTAVAYILNEQRKPLWIAQETVSNLEKNWKNAERNYRIGNYKLAEEYATQCEKYIKNIMAAGIKTTTPKPLLSQETIFTLIGMLILLLIVVYIIEHRQKLFGRREEEERVDIYGFNKKI